MGLWDRPQQSNLDGGICLVAFLPQEGFSACTGWLPVLKSHSPSECEIFYKIKGFDGRDQEDASLI